MLLRLAGKEKKKKAEQSFCKNELLAKINNKWLFEMEVDFIKRTSNITKVNPEIVPLWEDSLDDTQVWE